ncbi:hypothetical protein IW138_001562 [Coemansia sp. RSA 986]|nr:hypothetical protein LPJ74_001671 [Coemansia sp. RSA 1843]KAJ2091873.1 hypothetical protein IW138_001562 [Coemansia sp. RSA 986]
MSLGPSWATSAPLPTYIRRDNDADDGAAYHHTPAQPSHAAGTVDQYATLGCNLLPVPVRLAIDFCIDVAQLTMPTLFIPELRNIDCPIEDLVYRSKKALSYSSSSSSRNNNNNTMNEPNGADSDMAEQNLGEPGDTFGFEFPQPCPCSCKCCTDRCCFVSSAATLRNWMAFSWHGLGNTGKGLRYRLSPLRPPNANGIPYKIVEETLELVNDGEADPTILLPPPNYEQHLVPFSHDSVKHAGNDTKLISQRSSSQNSYRHYRHDDAKDTARNTDAADISNTSKSRAPASLLASFATPVDSNNDAVLEDGTYTERLFTVNRYLLRRIRKLELTNQIIREAYSEVQEILEAERQSKATQISALEKKHDEELNDLYTELTGRKDGHKDSFSISLKSLNGSDSDSDSDYSFRPGFSTVMSNEPKTTSTDDYGELIRCSSSSPILRNSNSAPSPPRIQRSVSDLAFSSSIQHGTKASGIFTEPPELEVEFFEPASKDAISKGESDEEKEDDDDNSSIFSGSGFASDDSYISDASDDNNDNAESDSVRETKESQRLDPHSCVFDVDMVEFTAPRVTISNDNESDLLDAGYRSDSESDSENSSNSSSSDEDEEDEPMDSDSDISDLEHDLDVHFTPSSPKSNVHTPSLIFDDGRDTFGLSDRESDQDNVLQLHMSPDDYAVIDSAKAVLERYYSKTGLLSLAADIDDLPEDYEEEDGLGFRFRNTDNDDAAHSTESATGAGFDSGSGSSCGAGGYDQIAHPGNGEKSFDDREMEHIAQLPPDQRIAKFVYRASSHLLQGARGGLSLGFMLHNLEALAEKFASNHTSILCAFVESLYQIVEQLGQTGGSGGQFESSEFVEDVPEQQQQQQQQQQPRSAFAKKVHEGICSPQQAARRVAKLLHTFITLPEDQHTVLHQLEQLSEANGKVRPFKHALLLRILYECELVDCSSIEAWYSSAQQQQQDGLAQTNIGNNASSALSAVERSQLLRKNAASLIVEISSENHERSAGGSRLSLDEMHHQMQTAGGASSCTMSQSSTSSSVVSLSMPGACGVAPAVAYGHFAGTTTPVSEENSTLNSHSSECEFTGASKSNASAASILTIGRRGGGRLLSSTALGSEHLPDGYYHHCTTSSALGGSTKPAKQVTFTTMHPAAAISVTHKDVDDLAAAQRMLLGQVQKGKGKLSASDAPTTSKTPQRISATAFSTLLGSGEDKTRDGFSIARQRRQNMSVSERLGI